MKKAIMISTALLTLVFSQSAIASDESRHMHGQHMHGAMHGEMNNPCSMEGMHNKMQADPSGMQKGTFLIHKDIDGYDVSFHIMKAPADKAANGSHHLMVKIEKDGKAINNLMANSKATHPNGQSESKMLMKMGDWYMAAYDLGHAGEHKVMVLFKTADGVKHFGGIDYPGSN